MNRWVAVLVLGMVALVVGAQGVIRLLVDPSDRGLMVWVPGGTAGAIAANAVLVLVGAGLAALGDRRRR